MKRSIFDGASNPRNQLNTVTSFLDGSQIYGSSADRATALRELSGGRLKTSSGGLFPPLNTFGFPMDNDAGVVASTSLYFVGDVRGNENPGLMSLHTLFLREHNRLAAEIATANPTWTDDQIYYQARKWVIAFLQQITTTEYIPAVLGEALPAYTGYNDQINPSIFTEFSTGAFRYGHTEVNTHFWRLTESRQPTTGGHLPLRNYFFNPSAFNEGKKKKKV
jgi:hypothetical protein